MPLLTLRCLNKTLTMDLLHSSFGMRATQHPMGGEVGDELKYPSPGPSGHPLPQGERESLPYFLCPFSDKERKKLRTKNPSPLVGEGVLEQHERTGEGY